jgi:hypothetical protein
MDRPTYWSAAMARSHTRRPTLSYPEARTLAGQERAIALRALMLQVRDWLKTIRTRWPAVAMVEPGLRPTTRAREA